LNEDFFTQFEMRFRLLPALQNLTKRGMLKPMKRLLLILLLFLLAGCGRETTAVWQTPGVDLPHLRPTFDAAPETEYPYPASPEMRLPTTLPTIDSYPIPEAWAEGPARFRDCSITPDLADCAEDPAPALPARLAAAVLPANGSAYPALLGLDLRNGKGWQVALEDFPTLLNWSPRGSHLLVGLPQDSFHLYQAGGRRSESFQSAAGARWLAPLEEGDPARPGGADVLDRGGALRSAQGETAQVERASGGGWQVRLAGPGAPGRLLLVPVTSAEEMLLLRGWVPGRRALLLQRFVPGGAAMAAGGQVLILDLETGALQDLEVRAPLEEGAFAWNPARPLLALLTAEGPLAGPDALRRLALYDDAARDLRYPLPDGVIPGPPAWSPDGERLVFPVELTGGGGVAPAAFPQAGMYSLDPQAGSAAPPDELALLLPTPAGAVDGWPHWTADGAFLVYARTLPALEDRAMRSAPLRVQVRARRAADAREWVLLDALVASYASPNAQAWNQFLAFAPLE
jgi:hypothetical protein